MESCLKCGVCLHPTALVVFYKVGDKFRKKTMPLRQFKIDSNCSLLAVQLQRRHNIAVPLIKVERMLRIAQELLKGQDKDEALEIINEEFQKKNSGDLNKLSTKELDQQKEQMDSLFHKNQIRKDDPTYVYDKVVDFSEQKEQSTWDEDEFW